jgi:hypothetical protein
LNSTGVKAEWAVKNPAGGGKRGLIIICGQHNLEIVKRDWRQNQWLA